MERKDICCSSEYVTATEAPEKIDRSWFDKTLVSHDEIYADIVCAFDIETSPYKGESVMYIWQFQVGTHLTVIGRTWEEYIVFMDWLADQSEGRIVVYVHNLSYEFQFLRSLFAFSDITLLKSRRPLKALYRKIEYRCSYIHSNMSLEQYTYKMGAPHLKLSNFDYGKDRMPWDDMSEDELEYCLNDVRGLVESIMAEMEWDGDNVTTIPLTSTGYLRRECKEKSYKYRKKVRAMWPTPAVYNRLREAFRGGNTHANRYYVGRIIDDVHSYDRSSSYPDVQLNDKFPVTLFRKIEAGVNTVKRLITNGYALLITVRYYGLELQDPFWGFPYLPLAKARHYTGEVNDNGRFLAADQLEVTLTDLDWRIIEREYKYEDIEIIEVYKARYGKLPVDLTSVILDYYNKKTSLKDVEGQEVYYMKAKNKLNSAYGMTAEDPLKPLVELQGMKYVKTMPDINDGLAGAKKRMFLPYQWGVWTTAWARYRLEEALWIVGDAAVYVDTDSVKYIGDADFTDYNQERQERSIKTGAYADDPKGNRHYMGVYEEEATCDQFITWGAKKYAYSKNGKIGITVAGVPKKEGAAELQAAGGLEAFRPGLIFRAGKLRSVYNDTEVRHIEIDGHKVLQPSNVLLEPVTYELSITPAYKSILDMAIEACKSPRYKV